MELQESVFSFGFAFLALLFQDDDFEIMDSLNSSGILQPAANSNHTQRQIVTNHSIQASGSFSEQNYSESTDSEGAIQVQIVQITEQAQSFGTRFSGIVEIEQETGFEQEFSCRDESADPRGAIRVQTVQITEKDQYIGTRSSRIVEIEEEETGPGEEFCKRDESANPKDAIEVQTVQIIEADQLLGKRSSRIVEIEEQETGSEESQNRGNVRETRNEIGEIMRHLNESMQMIEGAALRHVIPRSDAGAFMEYMGYRKIRPCPAGARLYGEFELRELRSIMLSYQRYIPRAGQRTRFYVVDARRWLWLMGLHRHSPGQIAVEMDAVLPNFRPQRIPSEAQPRLNQSPRYRAERRNASPSLFSERRNASRSLFSGLCERIGSCFLPTP